MRVERPARSDLARGDRAADGRRSRRIGVGPRVSPLRRMAKVVLAALLALAALLGGMPGGQAEVPPLKRGVNFELWQHWTNRETFLSPGYDTTDFPDWSRAVSDEKLAALHRQGFDFVRLNVDPSPFLWDESRSDRLLESVAIAVRRLQKVGFAVVVDLHLVPDGPDRPEGLHYVLGTGGSRSTEGFERYLAIVRKFAARFEGFPAEATALELINEPDQDWFSPGPAGDRWPGQLARLYRAARDEAPRLALVLSGPRGGGLEGLLRVDPKPYVADDAVIWSFHIYDPGAITHSGLPWEKTSVGHFLTGLPFPAARLDAPMRAKILARATARLRAEIADPAKRAEIEAKLIPAIDAYVASTAGPETIERDVRRAADWAKRAGIPAGRILVGEFGVFQDEVEAETRAAILRATREAAEREGFAWAVYTAGLTRARSSFGILDDTTTMRVDDRVSAALGLRRRGN